MTVTGRHRVAPPPHWWNRARPGVRRRRWLRPAGPPPPGWTPTASHVPTTIMRPPWGRSARLRARYNLIAALALFVIAAALLLGALTLRTVGPPLHQRTGEHTTTAPAAPVYHDR